MSTFLKSFLRDRGDPGARQLFLAGFGKHPGWDDHMDDLGLETESLVLAKKLLYTHGIGGQIAAGSWEKLPEDARVPAFNHTFAWMRGEQAIVGRMWTSSDGKRRTRYPMIACVQVSGGTCAEAIVHLLPLIESLEATCKATRSANEVRGAFDDSRQFLRRQWLESSGEERRAEVSDPDQLANAISAIQRELRDFLTGSFRESRADSHHVRLPELGSGTAASLLGWTQLLALLLDEDAPRLLASPSSGPWCDLIAGEPTSAALFCLRAAAPVLPIVGGEIDSDRLSAGRAVVDRFLHPEHAAQQQRPWLARLFGTRS